MNIPIHILRPPQDKVLREQLEEKLKEYRARKMGAGKDWKFTHPDRAHHLYAGFRDACYKEEVLSGVLAIKEDDILDTHELSLKLALKYGDDFNIEEFCNACGVIAHYLGQKEEPTSGGTGLPPKV